MSEALQAEQSEQEQFDDLYRAAFDLRRRLDLGLGDHVFDIEHPEYYRVVIQANAYDDMSVTFRTIPREIGKSIRGSTYMYQSWLDISRRGNGDLRYCSGEFITYASRWSGNDFDSELDSDDGEFDFSEPLPSNVSKLIHDANEILPSLTIEQYQPEEGEGMNEEWFNSRYDRELVRTLQELDAALSTAGGAYYILQLVMLERYRASGETGKEFVIPPHPWISSYTITGVNDTATDAWHPDVIRVEKNYMGGAVRTYDNEFSHIETHEIFEDEEDGSIHYVVEDRIHNETESLPIDNVSYRFQPEDALTDDMQKMVKHLLKAIVGKSPIG